MSMRYKRALRVFLESHKWRQVSRVQKTNGDFWRERCLFGKCREYVLNDPPHLIVWYRHY